MELSESFSIDPQEPWVISHNKEAREVIESFNADKPVRVPVLCGEWSGQHGFYADEVNLNYKKYYTDPDEMIRIQLETAKRRRELPIYDMVLGEAPEQWNVTVDFWPVVAPSWVGCEIMYRQDSVIAHRGLELSKKECEELEMPDPVRGGILETTCRFWEHLKEQYQGKLTFLGRPIGKIGHGVGSNGLFSLALDLRGQDVMTDMYEDPEFVHRFLGKLADWIETLNRTWAGLSQKEPGAFGISDHGIDMLSPETYEQFIVPHIVMIHKKQGITPPTQLHHCGRGAHLFPIIKKHFGLTVLDALTYPLLDIAKVRRDVGEEVWIRAHIEDAIIKQGPAERIRQVVEDLMRSGAKGKGRLALKVGDMLKGTPLEHRTALYEAVKEFGRY